MATTQIGLKFEFCAARRASGQTETARRRLGGEARLVLGPSMRRRAPNGHFGPMLAFCACQLGQFVRAPGGLNWHARLLA